MFVLIDEMHQNVPRLLTAPSSSGQHGQDGRQDSLHFRLFQLINRSIDARDPVASRSGSQLKASERVHYTLLGPKTRFSKRYSRNLRLKQAPTSRGPSQHVRVSQDEPM